MVEHICLNNFLCCAFYTINNEYTETIKDFKSVEIIFAIVFSDLNRMIEASGFIAY